MSLPSKEESLQRWGTTVATLFARMIRECNERPCRSIGKCVASSFSSVSMMGVSTSTSIPAGKEIIISVQSFLQRPTIIFQEMEYRDLSIFILE